MRILLAFLTLLCACALAQAQTVSAAPSTSILVCAYNTSPPAITTGAFAYVQCDANGKLLTSANLPRVIGASGTAVPLTGSSSETELATCTLPANSMSASGHVEVTTLWSFTGSTNSKTLRVRWGGSSGTVIQSAAISTASNVAANLIAYLRAAGATNAQVAVNPGAASYGSVTSAAVFPALDTTSAQIFSITGTLATSSETITLLAYTCTLYP